MTLDVVSCLALLDIYKAKTIPHMESDLFYLDAVGLGLYMRPSSRYVFFCTSTMWTELVCDKLFQERFEASLHFSLVQKGILGSIRIWETELFLITDAFAAPFDKLDLPTGFYLFALPLDSLHELKALRLHTDSTSEVRRYEYLSM